MRYPNSESARDSVRCCRRPEAFQISPIKIRPETMRNDMDNAEGRLLQSKPPKSDEPDWQRWTSS